MLTIADRKQLWPILLLASLVLAAAVWPAGTGPQAAAAPTGRTLHTLIVSAAAFNPTEDGVSFSNGTFLRVPTGGTASFAAPLSFPYPEVTIKKITFYAKDNGASDITLYLDRVTIGAGGGRVVGQVSSQGQSAEFQAFTTTDVGPRTVNGAYHSAHLVLDMPAGGAAYIFFSVVIRYEA
jgi:hypothetical protein